MVAAQWAMHGGGLSLAAQQLLGVSSWLLQGAWAQDLVPVPSTGSDACACIDPWAAAGLELPGSGNHAAAFHPFRLPKRHLPLLDNDAEGKYWICLQAPTAPIYHMWAIPMSACPVITGYQRVYSGTQILGRVRGLPLRKGRQLG